MKGSTPVVRIQEPCPMTLDSMTRAQAGFYCASCSKVVVDFRGKSNTEILDVINSAGRQGTCGIFTTGQAARGPKPTFELVRFAAAVLLVFGSVLFSSCGDGQTIGALRESDSIRRADSILANQTHEKARIDSTRIADSLHAANCDTLHMIGFTEPDIQE